MSDQVAAREWEKQVMQLARLFRWRVAHFRAVLTKHGWQVPVAADGQGWPDLCLVRERVIYAELKTGRGKLEPEQIAWRDALLAAGQEWYEWRPEQLEEISRILRRRGGGRPPIPTDSGLSGATRTDSMSHSIQRGNAGHTPTLVRG